MEEKDAPPQVLLASMDTRYDCISNLGLSLEYHYELNTEEHEFSFAYSGLDDPIRIEERLRHQLTDVLKEDEFVMDREGLLGTHSVRKMAVTFAQGNGCTKVSKNCLLPFGSMGGE